MDFYKSRSDNKFASFNEKNPQQPPDFYKSRKDNKFATLENAFFNTFSTLENALNLTQYNYHYVKQKNLNKFE